MSKRILEDKVVYVIKYNKALCDTDYAYCLPTLHFKYEVSPKGEVYLMSAGQDIITQDFRKTGKQILQTFKSDDDGKVKMESCPMYLYYASPTPEIMELRVRFGTCPPTHGFFYSAENIFDQYVACINGCLSASKEKNEIYEIPMFMISSTILTTMMLNFSKSRIAGCPIARNSAE